MCNFGHICAETRLAATLLRDRGMAETEISSALITVLEDLGMDYVAAVALVIHKHEGE